MNYVGSCFAQNVDLQVIHVHAVGGQDLALEEAELLQPGDDGHVVGLPPLLHFLFRLGDMDMKRDVELERQIDASAHDGRGAGIGRVRRHRGDDERVILPALFQREGSASLQSPPRCGLRRPDRGG